MNKSATTNFVKYQGTGNDFIIIDGRGEILELPVKLMCDRHFGIGADGLIILAKSETSDFEMIYYNSDGFIGSMCGNGARCSIQFAKNNKIINSETTSFKAYDGCHYGSINQNMISLSMNPDLEKSILKGSSFSISF